MVGVGQKTKMETQNHARFITQGCLANFLIKRLYMRPEIVEITFYHHAHTRTNGDPSHHGQNPKSKAQMF